MDDINQLTCQGVEELEKLTAKICSGGQRVSLSHIIKPRLCAENESIPDAIHGRISQLWPGACLFYATNKWDPAMTRGYKRMTAAELSALLISRSPFPDDNNRRIPLVDSMPNTGNNKHDELVIIVDLDPDLKPECAILMVLLAQRAGELHHKMKMTSRWRMHIITISDEELDPRIERLCILGDKPTQWCSSKWNTYTLEWSRHGTSKIVSLSEMCRLSNGRIKHEIIKQPTNTTLGIVEEPVLRLIKKSDATRHMVICFQPWDRIGHLHEQLSALGPNLRYDMFIEDESNREATSSFMNRALHNLRQQQQDGIKLVFLAFLFGGSFNTTVSGLDSVHDWNMIVLLGTTVVEPFVDGRLNYATLRVLKRPSIEDQLDQLSWAYRTDMTATMIITGLAPNRLFYSWGNMNLDENERKIVSQRMEFVTRLKGIENGDMASFICAMIALEVTNNVDAAHAVMGMIMRHGALVATSRDLRYQGVVYNGTGNAGAPKRLRLSPRMGNEYEAHQLFMRLLVAFNYDYKPVWMICNSWDDDGYTMPLVIMTACALNVGLDKLLIEDELEDAIKGVDGGLEALTGMCRGPFQRLAHTGTTWLKLGLIYAAASSGLNNFVLDEASNIPLPNEYPLNISIHGAPSTLGVSTHGLQLLRHHVRNVTELIMGQTGRSYDPGLAWKISQEHVNDNTLCSVQRRMLDAYILDIVLSRPCREPKTVHWVRNAQKLSLRYNYIEDMISRVSRDLPTNAPDMMFGITVGIPTQMGNQTCIAEWNFIPRNILLGWHNMHHGEQEPLLGALRPK